MHQDRKVFLCGKKRPNVIAPFFETSKASRLSLYKPQKAGKEAMPSRQAVVIDASKKGAFAFAPCWGKGNFSRFAIGTKARGDDSDK